MKMLVYWIGLILIGLDIWRIYMAIHLPSYWRLGSLSGPAILLVGAIIFIVIG